MLKRVILLIIIGLFSLGLNIPKINEKEFKQKMNEIFSSHATYKELNNSLIERILKNYLEELDPTKTYFIESDIQKWLIPTDEIINQIFSSIKKNDFLVFFEIYEKMTEAIDRRNKLEIEVGKSNLIQNVDPEEFKDLTWSPTKNELLTRLLKIKSLQLDAVKKFEKEDQEVFFNRLKKRRILKEKDFLDCSENDKKSLILSNVLKSFCASLDSHTNYLSPSEAKQLMIEIQQRLFGIGALLKDNLNGFEIVRIIEKSAAEKVNLKIKDKIIAVNKEPVIGLDITEVVEKIRGEKGSEVMLTIVRPSKDTKKEDTFDITLKRDEVVLEESRFEKKIEPYADGIIAHLKLHSFYQDPNSSSSSDIKKAIENLNKKNKIKGIILDLRSNTGGLLPQAVEVVSLFISKGIVVSIKDNNGNIAHLRDTEGKITYDGPLVVLVNKASASASEIVAQTLQDYGRAIIVGDLNTFGKGTYQTFTLDSSKNAKVNPSGEYKVTKGKYYTVSGKTPQLTGVQSDITVPGILSELEIGEKYSKYPLENDKINPNFDDDLSDIPLIHRKRISLLYKHNLQQVTKAYTQYLGILNNNSKQRIDDNKNYQNFLKEIKDKNYESESIDLFNQSDLQLQEAMNITKDLIYLTQINDKLFE
ncbi:MAG: Tail-specific protease [Candidatus Anoxychlamydiales bacterium]|nr:Tail-specific protease [Candidatus Anoxychlamydiales bacterium]